MSLSEVNKALAMAERLAFCSNVKFADFRIRKNCGVKVTVLTSFFALCRM